jgi:hypothetical protein
MAFKLQTTKEIKDQNVSTFQSNLNQTVAPLERAFIKVLSAIDALNFTQLGRYAADRARQTLALTATGEGLDIIGRNFGVIRKPAVPGELKISVSATTGTVFPITIDYVGDANNVRYLPKAQVTAAAGVAEIEITADTSGVAGNLNVGDTVSLGSPVANAASFGTVTEVLVTGAERESDDDYRARILNVEQTVTGGGNAANYRTWAEATPGVARAYPYSGRPRTFANEYYAPDVPDLTAAVPGERVIYIRATEDIDPDGIAPQSLLDSVRTYINNGQVTGISNPPLGMTDDDLYIESIDRLGFIVYIRNLVVNGDVLTTVQSSINENLRNYFKGLEPFVDGLDSGFLRNDTISMLTVSQQVQDVLNLYSGSAESITFGTHYIWDAGGNDIIDIPTKTG